MCCENRIIALGYRLFAFFIGAFTLLYDLGVFAGEFKRANFFYFTIISNFFCCALFFCLSIKTLKDLRAEGKYGASFISPHIKGAVLMCILLTMTVYHFILIPYALNINPFQSLKWTDIVFHYLTPCLTLLDWILFDKKNGFKWYDPFAWVSFPLFYAAFVFFQARFDIADRVNSHISRYVYAFLDVSILGWKMVLTNMINLAIAFVIVGYFIYVVDKVKV